MAREKRSNYSFELNYDVEKANSIIKEYLSVNEFKFKTKNGESYYRCGSWISGYKYFKYSFLEQTLNISCWVVAGNGEFALVDTLPSLMIIKYKTSLSDLFNVLKEQSANIIENNNILNNKSEVSNVEEFTNDFVEKVDKKNETICEVSFWVSILVLFLAICSVYVGLIYYFIFYGAAIIGLKTKKKGKAIAAIILFSVSFILRVAVLFL